MQKINEREEVESIVGCLNSVLENFKKNGFKNLMNFEFYDIYVDTSTEKLDIILEEYFIKRDDYQFFQTNNQNLKNYEKAACLAIAIKENPCFKMTDKLGIINYSILNSVFAIETALKFCESDLLFDINSEINEHDILIYSKQLLINILEQKYVYPIDISDNIKLEIDLINNFFNIKKIQKVKKNNN